MPRLIDIESVREGSGVSRDLPVIPCTGFSDTRLNGFTPDSGIRAVLMKPFSGLEIAGTIRNVLENRARRTAD